MENNERALRSIELKCSERGFTLVDKQIETPVNYGLKRRVIHECGLELNLRCTNRDLVCPICSGKYIKDKSLSYHRAVSQLKEIGYELLCTQSDWVGYKNGTTDAQYLVRHTVCGAEFHTSVYLKHMSKCPICDRSIRTTDNAYNEYIAELQSKKLTPLFKKHEWKGVTYRDVSGLMKPYEYPVKCNECGFEFSSRIVPGRTSAGINSCPYCTGDKSTLHSNYVLFLKDLEEEELIPLFEEKDFTGLHHRNYEHKLVRVQYPVKCMHCGTEFLTSRNDNTKVKRCQCKHTKTLYRSKREIEITEHFSLLGHRVFAPDRRVLGNSEIDIYFPDKGVGFEFNGMFFHSSSPLNPSCKPRDYHSQKTKDALKAGVKLYHIWEDCPDDLVYSIIESKLGISNRVFARKLILVDNADKWCCAKFFNESHVDGNNNQAERYIALVDSKGTIFCCMSLMRRRIQASGEVHWEIGRFANKKHYTVVGGYSRVLKCAIQYLKSQGVSELVSYCNVDISPDPNETFYAKYGFEFVGESAPIYWYHPVRGEVTINGKTYKGRVNRQVVQKQKLLKHFRDNNLEIEEFDTEKTLCQKLGLVPVYNSGNFKYVLQLK